MTISPRAAGPTGGCGHLQSIRAVGLHVADGPVDVPISEISAKTAPEPIPIFLVRKVVLDPPVTRVRRIPPHYPS